MSVRKFPGIDTYPDLGPPEVLPLGFAKIKFLPGQQNPPPNIMWGEYFDPESPKCQPIEAQLIRVKKVASAMNHAAEVAQRRVSEMIDIANHQEEQLQQWQVRYDLVVENHGQLVAAMNAEKQERLAEMQALKARVRALEKETV